MIAGCIWQRKGVAPATTPIFSAWRSGCERADSAPHREIKQHVLNNLAFWAEHAVDREHGGFWTHLNRDGSRYDDGQKFLVMQARMIYAFAIGYLWSGDSAWKEFVEHGVRFLQEKMRDPRCGGWFWTVSREGDLTNGSKLAYGHAFVVYALAYAGHALNDDALLHDAEKALHWTYEHLWDANRGGYVQSLTRCLFPLDNTKRLDTQLHSIEGASAVAEFCGSPFAREHLRELASLVATRTLHPNGKCAREWFLEDWQENLDSTEGNVSIGHNLETAWFLRAVGLQLGTEQFTPVADALLKFCLQHGWTRGVKRSPKTPLLTASRSTLISFTGRKVRRWVRYPYGGG